MRCIAELPNAQGQMLTGQFRVMDTIMRTGPSGDFVQLTLADYSGSIRVNAQLGNHPDSARVSRGEPVQATLRPRILNGLTVATVENFQRLLANQITNPAALIPRSEVPPKAHGALASLVQHTGRLGRPESLQFMRRLLLESDVYRPLVAAPAGKSYHHAFPGGLLVHTVGCIDKAIEMTRWVCSGGTSAMDLAVLGAFIHDLGKIRTLGGDAGGTLFHKMRHELMTAPIIAEPLREMALTWQHGADRLGELVNWLSLPPAHRQKRVQFAEIVHWADALDVMADRAPKNEPDYQQHAVPAQSTAINKRSLI